MGTIAKYFMFMNFFTSYETIMIPILYVKKWSLSSIVKATDFRNTEARIQVLPDTKSCS